MVVPPLSDWPGGKKKWREKSQRGRSVCGQAQIEFLQTAEGKRGGKRCRRSKYGNITKKT